MASRLPSEFPIAEIRTVVTKIRSPESVSNRDAFESGWWLLGYAGGQLIPGEVTVAAPLSPEEVATILSDPAVQGLSLPWHLLFPAILKLVELWANSRK